MIIPGPNINISASNIVSTIDGGILSIIIYGNDNI